MYAEKYTYSTRYRSGPAPPSDTAKSLKKGDVAGLGLLNVPYCWIGVVRTDEGFILRFYDLVKNQSTDEPLSGPQVYLRANGDYNRDWQHSASVQTVKHLKKSAANCVWGIK